MNYEEFNEYLTETFESAARFASLFKWLLPRMECKESNWQDYVDYIERLEAEGLSQEASEYLDSLSTEEIQEQMRAWFNTGIRWSLHEGTRDNLHWNIIRRYIEIIDPKPTRTIDLTGVL